MTEKAVGDITVGDSFEKVLLHIMNIQTVFQCMMGVDIADPKQIDTLSESYLFKAVEEIVELRRTTPAAILPYWKSQIKTIDREAMLKELADVLLYLSNFMLVREVTPPEILEAIRQVQIGNIRTLQSRIRKDAESKAKIGDDLL